MADPVTFASMPRSKPKTVAEGKEQLSSSLARMASTSVGSGGIPITEVGFGQCRFVIDDRNFPAVCCGAPTLGGSWCAQHRALVFVRVAVQPNGRRPAPEPSKEALAAPVKQPAQPAAAAPVKAAPPKPAPSSPVQAKAPAPGKASAKDAQKKVEAPAKAPPEQRTSVKAYAQRPPASSAKGAGVPKNGSDRGKEKGKAAAAGRRGSAASAKRGSAERPSAAKKAAAKAKGAAKRPVPAKKPAAAASKKAGGRRSAPAKKTAAPRKKSAVKRPPPAKKAASRKRGARKKAS
jgi:hypothetical protein